MSVPAYDLSNCRYCNDEYPVSQLSCSSVCFKCVKLGLNTELEPTQDTIKSLVLMIRTLHEKIDSLLTQNGQRS